MRITSSCLRPLGLTLFLAGLYVATARLGLTLALPPEAKATAVWPPSGIALAAVVLLGRRAWPGIWLGAFLANFLDYFAATNQLSLATQALLSSGIAIGSTVQALLGGWLVQRWIGGSGILDRTRSAFRFMGIALLVCLVASTTGVTTMCLVLGVGWNHYSFNWRTWWVRRHDWNSRSDSRGSRLEQTTSAGGKVVALGRSGAPLAGGAGPGARRFRAMESSGYRPGLPRLSDDSSLGVGCPSDLADTERRRPWC